MNQVLKLRKEHNFSQAELAEKLNVNRSTISRAEKGQPSMKLARRMASFYNVEWMIFLIQNVRKTYEKRGVKNARNGGQYLRILSIVRTIGKSDLRSYRIGADCC